MNPSQGEQLNSIEENKASTGGTDLLSTISKKIEDHHKLNPEQEAEVKLALESTISKSQRSPENLTGLIDTVSQSFKGIEDTKAELALLINMLQFFVKDPKQEAKYSADPILYAQKTCGTIKSSKVYTEQLKNKKDAITIQQQEEIKRQQEEAKRQQEEAKRQQEETKKQEGEKIDKDLIDITQKSIDEKEKSIDEKKQAIQTEQASINTILASLGTEKISGDYLQALQETKNPEGKSVYQIYKENIKGASGEVISDTELNNYIGYLATLNSKKNSGEVLSDTESDNLGKFESFLSSSGIEANDFFASLPQDTSNIIKDPEIVPSADSPSSLATLAEHSAYFSGLAETTKNFDPAFERQAWAKDEKLPELLPIPAGFEGLKKDRPEEITEFYQEFVGSAESPARIDYPLFASIEDPGQQISVRHLFFVSQLIDRGVITDESDMNNLALPAMKGFPTSLSDIKKLADQTFIPLLREQLNLTDTLIKEESGKQYMGLLSQMMALPALSEFQVNPEEVLIEGDGLKIPYRLPGHQEICGQITMNSEGEIFMTNMLYNEGDTSSTSIKIGKISVGSAPTLKQYNQAIGQAMTKEAFKEALASPQLKETINTTITRSCETYNTEVQKKFDLTQAELKHQLSGTRAQDICLQELGICHLSAQDLQSDPNLAKLGAIRNGSPFGEELRWYNYEEQSGHPATFDSTNNPDIAKALFPIRNSTLAFSDTENEHLASAIHQIGDLLRDPRLDKKLRDLNPSDLNEKNAILYHCFPAEKRKSKDWMPTLISLLCHPAPLERQTLSLSRFDQCISQLQGIKNDSITPASFDVSYDLHNPDFQKILDSKDAPNLEEELSSIDGSESNETIVV